MVPSVPIISYGLREFLSIFFYLFWTVRLYLVIIVIVKLIILLYFKLEKQRELMTSIYNFLITG